MWLSKRRTFRCVISAISTIQDQVVMLLGVVAHVQAFWPLLETLTDGQTQQAMSERGA